MPDTNDDRNTGHILVRHLPQDWQPYAALIRLDRPIGTYLAFLPALMGLNLAAFYSPQMFFSEWGALAGIFFLGAWCMRSAGCIWNDWLDRNLDKTVARTQNRPIASGQISPAAAIVFLLVLLLLAFFLLLLLPTSVFWAALVILPSILIYPMMKRWIDAPQVWLGITFNAGIWVAWLSVHGTAHILLPLMLYFGCIFWTLGYDTVYALQDVEDDEKSGIRSMARLLKGNEIYGIFVFYFFCCATWSMLLYSVHDQRETTVSHYSIAIFALAWLYIGLRGVQWYRAYITGKNNRAHGIFFRQNAVFGLIISTVWIIEKETLWHGL